MFIVYQVDFGLGYFIDKCEVVLAFREGLSFKNRVFNLEV